MKQVNISKLAMDLVLALGRKALGGLHKETDLEPKYITETVLRAKLKEASAQNNIYQTAKASLTSAQTDLDAARAKAFTFARLVRDTIKPKLGSQYSIIWDKVGFFNRTLEIPRAVPKVMGLVSSMVEFLKANPETALPGAVTMEIAAAIFEELAAACNAVAKAKSALRQKKVVRDEAMDALRGALTQLRRELAMVLSDDDSRWLAFGFNIPDAPSTPAAPEGLEVVSGPPGEVIVKWKDVANAERFHVFAQTVDAQPVRVATVTTPFCRQTGLTPGAHVKFHVTAVNAAGESVPSKVVEFTVPMIEADA